MKSLDLRKTPSSVEKVKEAGPEEVFLTQQLNTQAETK